MTSDVKNTRDGWYTVTEVSKLTGLTSAWVRMLAARGLFPRANKAGSTWLICADDISEYSRQRKTRGHGFAKKKIPDLEAVFQEDK